MSQYRSLLRHGLTVILLVAIVIQTGCGSLIHGDTQEIKVLSDPPGARVTKLGKLAGVTPCEVTLIRAHAKTTLILNKEGYPEQTVELKRGMSLWFFFGNLLFIPGYLVDLISGCQGEYPQKSVAVDLTK